MSLLNWIEKIQSVHVTDMDLSLERVSEVATRLKLHEVTCPVITVGGTNGKGSCVAGLEAIYMAAGYRVGAFTSPILFRHNEYIRIQGVEALDEQFCSAFERIEQARGTITLTPFEFNALAAFDIFHRSDLDVWILEVGLGGRYDAVNVIDADVAIVASIGIDHTEWLGNTREAIAYEKAGIYRKNKPAICGDFDVPNSLINYADELASILFCQNKDFGFIKKESSWDWWSANAHLKNLPLPKLALQNMATVLKAIELLQNKLPVNQETIYQALSNLTLPGRIQVIPGEITQIVDVSHNPAAAAFLANWLQENTCSGKTRAVFSMLSDKDILGTIQVMQHFIDEWYVASLDVKRGASLEKLSQAFQIAKINKVDFFETIEEAHQNIKHNSQIGDRIVIFGSFHTVANVIKKSVTLCNE